MKLTFSRADMLAALDAGAAAIDKKTSMPILQCALLSHDGTRATVTTTNLYNQFRTSFDCEGAHAAVALTAHSLADRVRAMPDGPVVLESKGDNAITLRSPGTKLKFAMQSMRADEFPAVVADDGKPIVTIQGATLAKLLASVAFAISDDEARPHVSSCNLEIGDGTVRAVATDGHRLATNVVQCVTPGPAVTALVARVAVGALIKLARLADENDVALSQVNRLLLMRYASASFGSQLVEAQFPPYQQVIPGPDGRTSAIVPRRGLSDAIKAVNTGADNTIATKVEVTADAIRVAVQSAKNATEAESEVPAQSSASVTVGVAGGYMIEALGALTEDEVRVTFGGPLDPIVLRNLTSDDAVHVVMPMRV